MRIRAAVALSLVVFCTTGFAGTLDYSMSAGVGHSDNITRVSSDRIGETMGLLNLDFDFKADSRRLSGTATSDLTFIDYLHKTYSNELVGRSDGQLQFGLVEDRISWAVRDDFGQAQIDPFVALTPTNRENVNYFSTGPDFSLHLGNTGFATLDGRYFRTTYETSDFDSNRWSGGLGVGRNLSSASKVSANVDVERVDFVDPANSNYDYRSAYLRYELMGARTTLGANIGGDQIEDAVRTSGMLLQVDMTRQLTPSSSLRLTAGKQLTDAATYFANYQTGAAGASSTAPPTLTTSPFDRRYIGGTWNYNRNRTIFGLSAIREDDRYSLQPVLDDIRQDFEASLSRQMTAALTGRVYLAYVSTNYSTVGSNFKDRGYGVDFEYRMSRSLYLAARFEHYARTAAISTGEFGENRGFLTIAYRHPH
jgi:hypothetical protein